ncbi:MAG: carbon monoxide dehydrogenase subunit G [Reyranellaceae bacterium]
MEMTGEYRIPAPRETVWAALNDPAILQACIPGCESLERSAENEFKATVRTKIGPVSARFSGKVTLSDFDPPKSYRISGEGQGGAAGFAKGGAVVTLEEDGAGTLLRYTANAQVGGKLAQIGSRLIDGTAKKLADEFFEAFAAKVGEMGGPAASGPAEAAAATAVATGAPGSEQAAVAPPAAPPTAGSAMKYWLAVAAVAVVVVVAWLIFR